MSEVWVTNTSPLILLGKIGLLHLLTEMPVRLIIPEEVAHEVMQGAQEDPARQWLTESGMQWIIPSVTLIPEVAAWDLGLGESAVLSWAYQERGSIALIDDLAARRCAQALEIQITGTLGVLLAAKRLGKIQQLKPLLDSLARYGQRLDEKLITSVLRTAGE